ncbi:MAG: MFS transporter [Jatrophihabitantaceae bacterium]
MPIGLYALAIGGFGIGLTEFVIMGLLPEVAEDFAVSIPTAGYLVSGYALSVVFGGIFLTAGVARRDRKQTLVALMILFILGNLVSAVAGSYTLLMTGRVVAALCHGAFFGVGSVLATSLVAPSKKGAAIAVMFGGLTSATVLGVPFGTFLGQQFGWRSTFWAITAIGVVAFLGLLAFVPKQHASSGQGVGLRTELHVFRQPQVWLSLLITVLGFGAMFGAFTYVAPMMTDVAGFADSSVSWLLMVFGVGLFVGNIYGGKAADRALSTTLLVCLAALTVTLTLFVFTAHSKVGAVITLFLLGAFGFASVPALQMRVLKYASAAPTLASGVNISAFNLGNALGAYLGGVTISAGFGYTSPSVVGAVLALLALTVTVLADARWGSGVSRRRRSGPSPSNVEGAWQLAAQAGDR